MLKILKLLASSSFFLGINGSLVVVFTCLLYGIPTNPLILVAAFLTVFSVYNLNKATDRTEDLANKRETASKSAVYYVILAAVSMFLSVVLGALISFFAVLIILTPIIVGFFYSIKFSRSLPRIKEIVGAKSVFVAFCWANCGCFLPLSLRSEPFGVVVWVFIYIFVELLINTILFDFLDMKGDSATGVKTLPTVLGKQKTKWLLLIINSTLGLWIAASAVQGLFLPFLPALVFGFLYGYLLIWLFLEKRFERFYAEYIVDGQWVPIVALMNIFVL